MTGINSQHGANMIPTIHDNWPFRPFVKSSPRRLAPWRRPIQRFLLIELKTKHWAKRLGRNVKGRTDETCINPTHSVCVNVWYYWYTYCL